MDSYRFLLGFLIVVFVYIIKFVSQFKTKWTQTDFLPRLPKN
jgi:hypothetical protein